MQGSTSRGPAAAMQRTTTSAPRTMASRPAAAMAAAPRPPLLAASAAAPLLLHSRPAAAASLARLRQPLLTTASSASRYCLQACYPTSSSSSTSTSSSSRQRLAPRPAAAGDAAGPSSSPTSTSQPAAAPAAAPAPGGSAYASSSSSSGGGSSSAGSSDRGEVELRSFDLRLPEAASAVAGLDALDDTELQQQAQDWGYTQLGRPFPDAISLPALAETLDPALFKTDLKKAAAGLAVSLALIAAGCGWQAYMHSICPLWQQAACWVAVGTGYFGAFQAAADCAHFAFCPEHPAIQDVVGAALMAPALIPYEGWRLQHFNHLLRPNMLGEDSVLWHPLTPRDLAPLPAWRRAVARVVASTPLRFVSRALASWAACWDGLDLKRHTPASRPWTLLSWAVPLAFAGVVWPALLAAGGLERLVGWWLMPWLVFLGWQGLFAAAQHTAPHIPFVEEGFEYDYGQAVVNGTVTIDLPDWLEHMLGAANLALPRTLSISIPWYNLRAAQRELDQKLGPYLTRAAGLNPRLVLNLVTRWVVYDPEAKRYVKFDEAEEAAEKLGGAAAGTVGAAAATAAA